MTTNRNRMGAAGLVALMSAGVNGAVFAAAEAAGWFDGVVATANDQPVRGSVVVVMTLVGILLLLALRFVLSRLQGPAGGRRTFLGAAVGILLLSLLSPVNGLDGASAKAVITLMATHVVAVAGAAFAAELLTKPAWTWGSENFRRRALAPAPVAVISGVTGGIGAATAVALAGDGFQVVGVGRSTAKADALRSAVAGLPGTVTVLIADMSSMREVAEVGARLADLHPGGVDAVVHAVGTLKPRSTPTVDGVDSNIATSWLSRVQLHRQLSLKHDARVVNVAAAESGEVPKRLMGSFESVDDLGSGATAHGQAQMANDLWVAGLQADGVAAFGYGPGSVETGIRREIPALFRTLIRPFFWWSTRRPDEAAADVVRLLTDAELPAGGGFASRDGFFEHNAYVMDRVNQERVRRIADTLLAPVTSDG